MSAMNWLVQQLAWEQRLTELRAERHRPARVATIPRRKKHTAKAA